LAEYVQVDKDLLKEILRELGEVKKLAMDIVRVCPEPPSE
jgi:hypothetical protein